MILPMQLGRCSKLRELVIRFSRIKVQKKTKEIRHRNRKRKGNVGGRIKGENGDREKKRRASDSVDTS